MAQAYGDKHKTAPNEADTSYKNFIHNKKYDLILIDCAPIIGLSDALILTQFSDANIMTFSIKKTKKENLERARDLHRRN